MTDEQIIKALECCKSDECSNCPSLCDEECLTPNMEEQVSLVIKRQKAEIEELRSDKIIAERHEKDARDLFVNCTQQLEEANAEIEGLEETRYELACIIDDLREERNRLLQKLQQAQSEAIKEFVKRLKDNVVKKYEYTDIRVFDEADKLAKEMTEE